VEAARLIVDVARLDREGELLRGEVAAAALDLDAASREIFAPAGGLCYEMFAQLVGRELLVRGRVSQRFRCLCTRCAATFEWEAVDAAVTVAMQPGGAAFVDLTGDLREAILLALPSHPLCRAECRGLCPRCGADLNRGPCGCPPADDDRWGTPAWLPGGGG
jgi:hypothetical protein